MTNQNAKNLGSHWRPPFTVVQQRFAFEHGMLWLCTHALGTICAVLLAYQFGHLLLRQRLASETWAIMALLWLSLAYMCVLTLAWLSSITLFRSQMQGTPVAYVHIGKSWLQNPRLITAATVVLCLIQLTFQRGYGAEDATTMSRSLTTVLMFTSLPLLLTVLKVSFGATLIETKGYLGQGAWHSVNGEKEPARTLTTSQPGKASAINATHGESGGFDDSWEKYIVTQPTNPRYSFHDIVGMTKLQRQLIEAAGPIVKPRPGQEHMQQQNGILLFGEPGNGKSFFAEALAGALNVPIIRYTQASATSQYLGTEASRLNAVFKQAIQAAPVLLFIDEIDSMAPDRSGQHTQGQNQINIVNTMITAIDSLRGLPVVLVAATNRIDAIDPAVLREGRFDRKIEVTPPDEAARYALLKHAVATQCPGVPLDYDAMKSVANRWEGYSSKRIQAVGEALPRILAATGAEAIRFDQFMAALRDIQGRKGHLSRDALSLADLVLPEATERPIQRVINRMRDPLRVESLGGTLPTGLLFHGPAGTGKTATAQAIAKDSGWAFLTASGPDLLKGMGGHGADPLDKLFAQAKEIRPVVVFIDEADQILASRDGNPYAPITNKMLTIMDGANGKLRDTLIIAGTNNPNGIDPAMLRGSRFTEKVPFFRADSSVTMRIVDRWFSKRKIHLERNLEIHQVALMLEGQSPANIEAVLQYALNSAIDTTNSDDVLLGQEHIQEAIQIVVP